METDKIVESAFETVAAQLLGVPARDGVSAAVPVVLLWAVIEALERNGTLSRSHITDVIDEALNSLPLPDSFRALLGQARSLAESRILSSSDQ